ncbi:phosphoglycerate kinase, cytosolic-like protein [Tanacetum coccineum]
MECLLLLPSDVVIADKLIQMPNSKWTSTRTHQVHYCEYLDTAKTVIWNGPIGVFEFEKFAAGTEAIARKLVDLSGESSPSLEVVTWLQRWRRLGLPLNRWWCQFGTS